MGNYRKETVVREYNGKETRTPIVFGTGNLTGDVEVREVTLGDGKTTQVAGGFGQSIAFNYKSKGEDKTDFYEVEAWGKTAELLGMLGKKGSHMFITGRHKVQTYTDKNGEERSKDVLVVEDFQMTPRLRDNGEGSAPAPKTQKKASPKAKKVEDVDMEPIDDEDIPF